MLTIHVKGSEFYDEAHNLFITIEPKDVTMEHSLVSISKWESKWHKPFLSTTEKTLEEEFDYFRCMVVGEEVNSSLFRGLSASDFEAIRAYIDDSMTATTFRKDSGKISREVVTSEVIYYWMVALEIPFECENWHLNRLLTLVRVCNVKNAPSKKMKKKDQMAQQRSLNAARRAKRGSKG